MEKIVVNGLFDYTVNDVVSSNKFISGVIDKENNMKKLRVSNKLYQLLSTIRYNGYPLRSLIDFSGELKKLTRSLSPWDEDVVMEYLANSEDVELEIMPDNFVAKKGDTITINGGTPITLEEDTDITGFEEI